MPSSSSSSPDSTQQHRPRLHHTIAHDQASVLAIAVDESSSLLFTSGSQSECIYVWNLATYRPIAHLLGHTAPILALELATERGWLFSASGDGTVRIWDVHTLSLLYIFQQPSTDEDEDTTMGDIFALRWSRELQTLYMGCQNTSIRWVRLSRLKTTPRSAAKGPEDQLNQTLHEQDHLHAEHTALHPAAFDPDQSGFLPATALPIASRPHKFFDSGPSGAATSSPPLSRSFSRSWSAAGGVPTCRSNPATPPLVRGFGSNLSTIPSQSPGRRTPELCFLPSKHESAGVQEAPTLDAAVNRYLQLHGNGQDGSSINDSATTTATGNEDVQTDVARYIQLSTSSKVPNAHYGYVYCLTMLSLSDYSPIVLASGSGDEDVKLWDCCWKNKGQVDLIATLSGSEGAVLALASWPGTLFAGKQGGSIDVWDLETLTLIRTLEAHEDDVLSLCTTHDEEGNASLISAGADGFVNRFDGNFVKRDSWAAHEGAIVLSCAILKDHSRRTSMRIITGGSDQVVRFWNLAPFQYRESSRLIEGPSFPRKIGFPITTTASGDDREGSALRTRTEMSFDPLLTELAKFVSYKSVASEARREDCRQCAHYLKSTLSHLGAQESVIVPGAPGRNPLVLSIFRARSGTPDQAKLGTRRRVLFYGHYDVIAARADKMSSGWSSDPFTLSGRDGYLYARGASDNKGPVLSVATAVSRLWHSRNLEVDVVMLIEGEEESGSGGFKEALEREKERIGKIDVVLLSNSYWIDDVTPCVTMGMRGVIQATVTISAAGAGPSESVEAHTQNVASPPRPHRRGEEKDMHSGVQGGAVREPMIDMLRLLSSLSDGEKVFIPDFYDSVRRVTDEERASYEEIVRLLGQREAARGAATGLEHEAGEGGGAGCHTSGRSDRIVPSTVESLMARWRFPSLSIHNISVSGSGNATVIPAVVTAKVSLRLVPDQDLETIKSSLVSFLQSRFHQLVGPRRSSGDNRLTIDVHHVADWWLGSADSPYTQALVESISQAWTSSISSPSTPLATSTIGNRNDSSAAAGAGAGVGVGTKEEKGPNGDTTFPLQIREGGSIPAVALLEKALNAPAVHLPMGQSSDNAHLGDERISMQHLLNGRDVVQRWLAKIPMLVFPPSEEEEG